MNQNHRPFQNQNSYHKFKSKPNLNTNLRCYSCSQRGHTQANCPNRNSSSSSSGQNSKFVSNRNLNFSSSPSSKYDIHGRLKTSQNSYTSNAKRKMSNSSSEPSNLNPKDLPKPNFEIKSNVQKSDKSEKSEKSDVHKSDNPTTQKEVLKSPVSSSEKNTNYLKLLADNAKQKQAAERLAKENEEKLKAKTKFLEDKLAEKIKEEADSEKSKLSGRRLLVTNVALARKSENAQSKSPTKDKDKTSEQSSKSKQLSNPEHANRSTIISPDFLTNSSSNHSNNADVSFLPGSPKNHLINYSDSDDDMEENSLVIDAPKKQDTVVKEVEKPDSDSSAKNLLNLPKDEKIARIASPNQGASETASTKIFENTPASPTEDNNNKENSDPIKLEPSKTSSRLEELISKKKSNSRSVSPNVNNNNNNNNNMNNSDLGLPTSKEFRLPVFSQPVSVKKDSSVDNAMEDNEKTSKREPMVSVGAKRGRPPKNSNNTDKIVESAQPPKKTAKISETGRRNKKIIESPSKNSQRKANIDEDFNCFFCHKGGELLCCDSDPPCQRVYHIECANKEGSDTNLEPWFCPECERIKNFTENNQNNFNMLYNSQAVYKTKEQRIEAEQARTECLLGITTRLLHDPISIWFREAVNTKLNPEYLKYIVNPMDLEKIEKFIKQKKILNPVAVLSFVKQIVHNCVVFNGPKSPISTQAFAMQKVCEHILKSCDVSPSEVRNLYLARLKWEKKRDGDRPYYPLGPNESQAYQKKPKTDWFTYVNDHNEANDRKHVLATSRSRHGSSENDLSSLSSQVSNNNKKDSFLSEIKGPFLPQCHPIIWAKLQGYPYWPAKLMNVKSQDTLEVCFFGEHDWACVKLDTAFHISKEYPVNKSKTQRKGLDAAQEEMMKYAKNIEQKYGSFYWYPSRTNLVLEDIFTLNSILQGTSIKNKIKQRAISPTNNNNSNNPVEMTDSTKKDIIKKRETKVPALNQTLQKLMKSSGFSDKKGKGNNLDDDIYDFETGSSKTDKKKSKTAKNDEFSGFSKQMKLLLVY